MTKSRLAVGRSRLAVGRSRLAVRDLVSEAVAGILQRPARSVLTALGTVLGVGAFISVLGLTGTAASQIDARFNLLTATEVDVTDVGPRTAAAPGVAFPADADARITRLNGALAAGVYWDVRLGPEEAVRAAPAGAADRVDSGAQVVAASPGIWSATDARFVQGRAFDSFHEDRRQAVAVIGEGTARRLGITTLRTHPAVFIGGTAFTVIGILEDVERKPELLLSVTVPRSVAERTWGAPADEGARMLVATRLGAAGQLAREAAVALRPEHPEYFKVTPPPDPRSLRGAVGDDLNQLFLLLAGVCLVVGAVGIANTTLVAVMERTGEIGLRRALGARGIHITLQFLAESAALGLVGGLVGTSIGTVAVVSVSAVRRWTPVIDPTHLALAPALGLAAGLLAGLYPAWRASRIPPVEALRR
ncbi:ABC transporter permease [Streptomyces lincolnensis]|uniref:ABC transporter permease n=1 Tax=Streptomyces lincolnensis TaxID=1915 RepID=UPI001E2B4068|nr:ABC transporter permease [Streptomyces lincolnensis]MCD7439218.1 ABC transporter permease [Streptomyces lincolnensis]